MRAITRRGMKKPAILANSTNYGQLGREDLEKVLAFAVSAGMAGLAGCSPTPRDTWRPTSSASSWRLCSCWRWRSAGASRGRGRILGAIAIVLLPNLLADIGLFRIIAGVIAAAALVIADYGYVLENGRLAAAGPTATLRNDPVVHDSYLGAAH